MDQISRKIVSELRDDGRMSISDLADRVGLSPSACSRRVAELENSGVIQGYRARIAPSANGGGFTAYVAVGLSRHTTDYQQDFERAMEASPAVRECHNITGAVEYLLRVEVPGLEDYKRFHADVLGQLSQVMTITSYIVMASPKDLRG